MAVRIIKAELSYAVSYGGAIESVAKERRFLASTVGFTQDSTRAFVEMILRDNFPQFYAVEGKEVVGWCDIIPRQFEGMTHVGVLGIGLLAPFRGKGLGSRLLESAVRGAEKMGTIEKIELEVFESNTAALAFYKKHGFSVEGVRVDARKLDGVYDNCVMMGKFL